MKHFRSLGMVKSPIDKRDFRYENVAPFMRETLPSKFRCRNVTVRDQERFGFCVGVGTASIKDGREVENKPGQNVETSALFIQYGCKQRDGIPYTEGTYPRIAMKTLAEDGVCHEKTFPYSEAAFPVPKPSIDAFVESANFKLAQGYAALHSIEEIKSALVNEGISGFGIMVTSSFMNPVKVTRDAKEYSFIPMPPEGYILGGHWVAVVGYDDNLTYTHANGRISKGYFEIQNSWSNNWGTKGYAWLPYDYFTYELIDLPGFKFLLEAWTIYDKRLPKAVQKLEMWVGKNDAVADGKPIRLDQPPKIDEHSWRTLVPLRQTCELFGLSVQWFPDDARIEIGDRIKLWLDDPHAEVDGKPEKLDQPPVVDGETWRTLIPVAFVMRTLGFGVTWEPVERKVTITRG